MSPSVVHSTALQKGDLVLITGGTGWVGSHVVDQALQHGLNVRLAYRSEAKVNELKAALEQRYPDATIETVLVPSFDAEGAYDEAFKDGKVNGVVHAASVIDGASWDATVVPVLKSYESILKAAAGQPSVKRFVLTSSNVALAFSNSDKDAPVQRITSDVWDLDSVRRAQLPDASFMDVYTASKVASEQTAWRFVRENKPGFVLNSVVPTFSIGRRVPGTQFSSSAQWLRSAVQDANGDPVALVGPQYSIDVDDVAILHVVALIDENVKNERILGYNETFTWDQIFDIAEKNLPNANTAPRSDASALVERNTVDNARTAELLKPYGGFKRFEDSLKLTLEV